MNNSYKVIDTKQFPILVSVDLDKKQEQVLKFMSKHNFCSDKHTRAIFVFDEPTTLHYGKSNSSDKTLKEHEIKSIFTSGYKNSVYNNYDRVNNAFYITGRMRTKGFRLSKYTSAHITEIKIIKYDDDYTTQWKNIANKMRKYNINLSVAERIEKHLEGEVSAIDGFGITYTKNTKPKRMSFKDVVDEHDLDFNNMIKTVDYNAENSDRKIGDVSFCNYGDRWASNSRDRRVYLVKNRIGNYYYSGASEYAGTGNGDYYVMYSPTMAIFAESD